MTKKPKVVVVGAGATGLVAAWRLLQSGADVTILEKADKIGGLAGSTVIGNEPLELFYHHIFESDTAMIELIQELGLGHKLHFYPANNGIYYNGRLYDFSTPRDILTFPPLGLVDRVRFAAVSAFLKGLTQWESLQDKRALNWMQRWAGKRATEVIWEPLLRGKFGDRADEISMAWLWARIHYRTFKLGYLNGGFWQVYDALAADIKKRGGKIVLGVGVERITSDDQGVEVICDDGIRLQAHTALVTVATSLFNRMVDLPEQVAHAHLGATCFTLELKQSLIPYYWLNINNTDFPFLAVVEHTRMVDTTLYGGKTVVYVGNYVPHNDWRFTTDPEELLNKYIPYLKKLNPAFNKKWITAWHFAKAPFAQPLVTTDYRASIPAHQTSLSHVYLANMGQIYPQDRGQNYAIDAANKLIPILLQDATRGRKNKHS